MSLPGVSECTQETTSRAKMPSTASPPKKVRMPVGVRVGFSRAMSVRQSEGAREARIARGEEVGAADAGQPEPADDAADGQQRSQVEDARAEPSRVQDRQHDDV